MTFGSGAFATSAFGDAGAAVADNESPGVVYHYAEATITVVLGAGSVVENTQATDANFRVTLGCFGSVEKLGPNGDDEVAGIWVPEEPAESTIWTPETILPGGLA